MPTPTAASATERASTTAVPTRSDRWNGSRWCVNAAEMPEDVVLVFVTVSGQMRGQLMQESYAKKVYAHDVGGQLMSAIQITTAAGICAMVDMLVAGHLPKKGFVRQEQADLKAFLANRFGQYYA